MALQLHTQNKPNNTEDEAQCWKNLKEHDSPPWTNFEFMNKVENNNRFCLLFEAKRIESAFS